jgi:hypothetical protein
VGSAESVPVNSEKVLGELSKIFGIKKLVSNVYIEPVHTKRGYATNEMVLHT